MSLIDRFLAKVVKRGGLKTIIHIREHSDVATAGKEFRKIMIHNTSSGVTCRIAQNPSLSAAQSSTDGRQIIPEGFDHVAA